MKTKLYLLLLCTAGLVFFGCTTPKNEPQEQEKAISCTPSTIDAPLSGGNYTIKVTSTSDWTASCNRTWVTLDSKSGQGNANVQLTIAKGEKDSANVVFSTGKVTAVVKIGRGLKDEDKPSGDDQPTGGDEKNIYNGHEYVDLGLSIKWATCNVGATKPEEYGDYYAWGEVATKAKYDWSTYKYCQGTSKTLTKYSTIRGYGTIDYKTILDKTDDAASYHWGGDWRMPTQDEWQALLDSCDWQSTTNYNGTGVAGRIVTGPNGNSIFLPATGHCDENGFHNVGEYGDFWSSTLDANTGGVYRAIDLSYLSGNYKMTSADSRCNGKPVRPVFGDEKPAVISSVPEEVTYNGAFIAANVTYDGGNPVTERGICYATTENPTINDSKVVNGSGKGAFFCELTGLKEHTLYYARAYAINSAGVSYSIQEIFQTLYGCKSGTANGHDYVDLGLSVKWATCNVGATKTEEFGDYYAWGEVSPKAKYDWSTYKYCKGSETTLTRYCTNSSEGTVDNKTILEKSDDAASYNWGGDWRMPTLEEREELGSKCKWEWIKNYNGTGVNGYIIIGSNGNSVFLPAGGFYDGSELKQVGERGSFWCSTLFDGHSYYSDRLDIFSNYGGWIYGSRNLGFSVRPVMK